MPEVAREVARAKLTRTLHVTGLRDDGYHLLESEMVSLDLADELSISAGDGLEVIDEIAWVGGGAAAAAGPRHGVDAAPGDDSNLVRQALKAVDRTASVRLVKHIPPGAGLGGGSSDAAGIMRWAGVLDPGEAARIGADVPFCVLGGRAVVRGVGELVEPLSFEPLHFVVVSPAISVSTPAVYRVWDELGGPVGENGNDLEVAALQVEPLLTGWRELVGAVSGLEPRLAGSGSSWFVECRSASEAESLSAEVSDAVVAAGERALVRACRTTPAVSFA
jgi:4-diphosphocytidyl-2-C-methyl-D-erythritol kinase